MRAFRITGILCTILFLGYNITSAKDIEVKGKVLTFEKYPVNNVSVIIKGTNKEFFTSNDGGFHIVCDEGDKLLFKANGFVTKRVAISKLDRETSSTINLKLKTNEKNLALAQRYGHLKPETLTHAFDFVDSNLDYGSYSKITDILSEKENRVVVNSYGVNIVGVAGKPLYVVDGSEVNYSYFESIPTTDIKSISILRNTASARYGMKGYGGVIEVTTK